MNSIADDTRDLSLLDKIENQPDVTQADLATQLGVAVGTVNWHIKRLISKGYVKVSRAERKKLRYIITPEGLAQRARLTVDYVDQQFNLYRRVRGKVKDHIERLMAAGFRSARIIGEGDVADICRLTCIEQHIEITNDQLAPVFVIKGVKIHLEMGEADD